jgi:regulatory Fis family protein
MVRGDYAAALGPSLQRNETMRAWGSRYARLILDRCGGNKRAACRVLGISYHTLQAYLRYPIHEPAAVGDVSWRVDGETGAPNAEPVNPAERAGPVEEPAACGIGDA